MLQIHSYTKSQLAREMGISMSTLHYYLNVKWYEELIRSGYDKNKKIIHPRIISIIVAKWWG
jgi:hypothetical protein